MPEETGAEGRRVLVLGSDLGIREVTSFKWWNVPDDLNVADFDVVILNLVSLEPLAERVFFDEKKLPDRDQFLELLFSEGGEVLAIGQLGKSVRGLPNTWWLPYPPDYRRETGTTLCVEDESFAEYLSHVSEWKACFTGHYGPAKFSMHRLQEISPQASTLEVYGQPIATTRYGKSLAVRFTYRALDERARVILAESGNAIWLPPPTDLMPEEAIRLLLASRYGVAARSTQPDWTAKYKLPDEHEAEAQVDEKLQAAQLAARELKDARAQLDSARGYKALLFEQGKAVLEPLVRRALQDLGAQVSPPLEEGREDGRFIAPGGWEGILEVKGSTGSLRLRDVRQLDQWVRDAVAEDERDYKGVLVANTHRGTDPAMRGEPFPSKCIKAASRFDLCLMTTTQLFRAIYQLQEGAFDSDAFWGELATCAGPCSLTELTSTTENL